MGHERFEQLERFGKYQLLERIGVGGMAEVFMAKTHGAEGFVKQLVIKRILPALSADPEFVRMFINEAHLAARLHHANIVQIFDFDHVDGVYYIAMEWVDGADLRRIQNAADRRKMPLPLNVAVHVGVEGLKGLHYAHSRAEGGQQLRLVHRDISPHNLLLSFSGEVKIADFGIAKAAAMASATRTGVVKGKLAYMAPEQIIGGQVDGSTDIFALGVVLWELIGNRRLYPLGLSEGELVSSIKRAEIPPISSVNKEVEPAIERILERMLAKEQADRYQTAMEALADLSELGAVGDTLLVSDYLRRLLPAEGERERLGQTAVDGSPGYQEACPQARTRTRWSTFGPLAPDEDASLSRTDVDDDQETVERLPDQGPSGPLERDAQGAVESAEALAMAPTLLDTTPGNGEEGERSVASPDTAVTIARESEDPDLALLERPFGADRRWTIWLTLAVLLPAALAGWFIMGGLVEEPQGSLGTPTFRALKINSEPSAAVVLVDGVQLQGATPLSVQVQPDATLSIKAIKDGKETRAQAVGADGTVLLRFPAVPAVAKAPRPRIAKALAKTEASAEKPAKAASSVQKPAKAGSGRRKRVVQPKARQGGMINIVVSPWAKVRIDGVSVGITPVLSHHLPVGRHSVELVNAELGRRERILLSIVANKKAAIRRDWTK